VQLSKAITMRFPLISLLKQGEVMKKEAFCSVQKGCLDLFTCLTLLQNKVIVCVRAQSQMLGSSLKQHFTRFLAHNVEADVKTSKPVHHLHNQTITFASSW